MDHTDLPPGPLMIDLAGLEPSPEELRRLAHPAVGGVILFAALSRFGPARRLGPRPIRSARPGPLVIAVDQEGGRVQRFRGDGFTPVAPMRRLGDEYERDPEQAVALAYDVGLVLGAELAAHGIDLTFAPVLDVEAGVSAVIGDRAFSHDPAVVARLAQALVAGLAMMGVRAVGKHFPGHGAVAADSHETLPVDSRPFEAIWQRDLVPYRHRLLRSLAGVMPAHVRYERCAPEPAGFSAFWLGEVLRQRLGFRAAVLSDDLGMAGAAAAGDEPQSRVAAARRPAVTWRSCAIAPTGWRTCSKRRGPRRHPMRSPAAKDCSVLRASPIPSSSSSSNPTCRRASAYATGRSAMPGSDPFLP